MKRWKPWTNASAVCAKPSRAWAGLLLITADHGNIELMRDQKTGEPHTAHTLLDVPIIAVNADTRMRLHNGRLADVTPTLLDLLGMEKPPQMTGHSLVEPQYGMQKAEIGP